MKILVKLTLTCVLTFVPTTIRAADKPAAVIYFSSFDKVLQRVREVLGAMGTPQVVQQLDLVMRGVMQGGKSLPGIDNWRSFGAYVEEAAVDPHFVVFVPVSDSKTLLSFLSSMVTLEPRGRDLYRVRGPVSAFLRISGRWAYVSQQELDLEGRMPDPSRLVPQDARRYDAAIIYNISSVPEAFKSSYKGARRIPMSRMPWESAAQFAGRAAARRILEKHVYPALDQMTEDLHHVTIGLNISSGDRIVLDSNIYARPGSSLSRVFSALGSSRGRFDAISRTDDALVVTWSLPLSQEMQTGLHELVYELESSLADRSDGESRLAAKLAAVLKENIEASRFEGGLTVSISPAGKIAVGVGLVLKNARSLEQDVLALIKNNVKANSSEKFVPAEARRHGQEIHGAYIRGPFPDPDIPRSFGKRLSVHFSFGEDTIVAAMGGDIRSLPIVSRLIQTAKRAGSGRGGSPLYMSMRILAWYSLGAMLHQDQSSLSRIIKKAMAGRDRFTVRVEPLRDGLRFRCEVQDGFLRMIAEVARESIRKKMGGVGAGFSPR